MFKIIKKTCGSEGTTVFIKEHNCFGQQFGYELACEDPDAFLRVWPLETLQLLLESQLAHQNYEMAEIIQKHIDNKTSPQCESSKK